MQNHIQNMMDAGNMEIALNMIEIGAEAARERDFDDYCCEQDTKRFEQWLNNKFNKMKLEKRWKESGMTMNFDYFCEVEYETVPDIYVA